MVMSVAATLEVATSRVRVIVTGVDPAAAGVAVTRSVGGGQPVAVRGARAVAPTMGVANGYDPEFSVGVPNVYTATSYAADGSVVDAAVSSTITPLQPSAWLKSVGRPALNMPVTLVDPGDVVRKSRSTAFDIVGSRTAVAVNDVHTSRQRDVVLQVLDDGDADQLDLLTSLGDILLWQAPPGCPVPTQYAIVGDVAVERRSRRGPRKRYTLPLTEVAAPDGVIAPYGGTWATLLAGSASWSAVLDGFAGWQNVAQLTGTLADVVVP